MHFFSASSSQNNRYSCVQKVIRKIKNNMHLTDTQETRIFKSLKAKMNNKTVFFHPKMRMKDVDEINTLNINQISNILKEN